MARPQAHWADAVLGDADAARYVDFAAWYLRSPIDRWGGFRGLPRRLR